MRKTLLAVTALLGLLTLVGCSVRGRMGVGVGMGMGTYRTPLDPCSFSRPCCSWRTRLFSGDQCRCACHGHVRSNVPNSSP